ncbi:hypothetical protein ACTXT7_011559 [Hymenolepis weldensis]
MALFQKLLLVQKILNFPGFQQLLLSNSEVEEAIILLVALESANMIKLGCTRTHLTSFAEVTRHLVKESKTPFLVVPPELKTKSPFKTT